METKSLEKIESMSKHCPGEIRERTVARALEHQSEHSSVLRVRALLFRHETQPQFDSLGPNLLPFRGRLPIGLIMSCR